MVRSCYLLSPREAEPLRTDYESLSLLSGKVLVQHKCGFNIQNRTGDRDGHAMVMQWSYEYKYVKEVCDGCVVLNVVINIHHDLYSR